MSDTYVVGTGGLPILESANRGKPDSFRPPNLLTGERYRSLDYRQSYFDCTQHDSKQYDFEGRFIGSSFGAGARPSMAMPGAASPLSERRPSSPYRLGRTIVRSFTNFVFGEDRFPIITVAEDMKTDDFAKTLALEGRLAWHMIRARNLGGGMGTVGMSWCIADGLPKWDVHNAKNLHAFSWKDRTEMIPEHICEVYPYYKVEWNGKEFANVYYWFRRDWTPDADLVFEDVRYEKGKEPLWTIDDERSKIHNDGIIHFEWIQNQPSETIDGLPDYDGCFDQLDVIDILVSIVARGGIANLDPTLILGIDPELAARVGIRKGSDNYLAVGEQGTASYLELSGSSIEVGLKLIDALRRYVLETSQCVIPDPATIAAQGISSVSQKLLYLPTTSCAQMLREQYGTPMERMLRNMTQVARGYKTKKFVAVDAQTKKESPAEMVMNLPPRVESEDIKDPVTGEVTDTKVTLIPRDPGQGSNVKLGWHEWFPATFADQMSYATTLTTSNGGKSWMSRDTSIELGAKVFGYDASEEKKRIAAQTSQDKAEQASMFPPTGNDPGDPGSATKGKATPFGKKPGPPKPPADADAKPPTPLSERIKQKADAALPVPPKPAE